MNKYSPEIATLRMDVEHEVKRKIRTPYDFEFLAGVIGAKVWLHGNRLLIVRIWLRFFAPAAPPMPPTM